MFMVLRHDQSHRESSRAVLLVNADRAPGGRQPSDQANRLGAV